MSRRRNNSNYYCELIFLDLYLREIICDECGVDKYDLFFYSVVCVVWWLGFLCFYFCYWDFVVFLVCLNIFKIVK